MDDQTPPKSLLIDGAAIVESVLGTKGFVFALDQHAKGSGGWFASGSFARGDRRLELHFRGSLGMVTYHLGAASLGHEDYMRLLGVYGKNLYPDFPKEPLDSFRSLASDLENFCGDFVSGDGEQFMALARQFAVNPNPFKGIP